LATDRQTDRQTDANKRPLHEAALAVASGGLKTVKRIKNNICWLFEIC